MLQIKLGDLKKVSSDGDSIFLSDGTGNYGENIYTKSLIQEDTYDVTTNETGYGEPNALREDYAIFPIGVLKASKGETKVTFQEYFPTSSSDFVANIVVDGWYKFNLIFVPVVESETSPYYLNGGIVQKVNGVVTTIDPHSLKDTQYCSPSEHQLFVANNSKRLILINQTLTNLRMYSPSNDREIRIQQKLEDELRGLLRGAITQFCRGNRSQAQTIIEFLNINIDNCN
jgi:hypothetical protein